MARQPLSGRQRPASWLVPVLPAGKLRHPRPGQDPGLFRGEVQLFVGPDDCWHDSTETEELDSMAGHTYQPGLSFDDVLSFLRCDFCRVSPRDIVWAYGEP